jgi:hypothetical protein
MGSEWNRASRRARGLLRDARNEKDIRSLPAAASNLKNRFGQHLVRDCGELASAL